MISRAGGNVMFLKAHNAGCSNNSSYVRLGSDYNKFNWLIDSLTHWCICLELHQTGKCSKNSILEILIIFWCRWFRFQQKVRSCKVLFLNNFIVQLVANKKSDDICIYHFVSSSEDPTLSIKLELDIDAGQELVLSAWGRKYSMEIRRKIFHVFVYREFLRVRHNLHHRHTYACGQESFDVILHQMFNNLLTEERRNTLQHSSA